MQKLPEFFTLSQLVRHWTDSEADEITLKNRRKTVRRNTIHQGCPYVPLGDETVFVASSFITWLLENETHH